MPTKQGDLTLLQDPVAQEMLQSRVPARLAYNWTDGSPRVVPIGFHWNGSEVVLGTPPGAPKLKALKDGDKVALSIDGDTFPYHVLLIRGTVRIDRVEGIAPEYAAMAHRVFGKEGGDAWLAQVGSIVSHTWRVFITPEWVGILDFEKRFPSAQERAMEKARSGG
jgi:hypothetical protein